MSNTNLKPYQPLQNYVVIEPVKPDEKSKGGIIIPEAVSKKEQIQKGIVFLKSDLVNNVSIGDSVLYLNTEDSTILIDGKEVLVMPVENLVMKV